MQIFTQKKSYLLSKKNFFVKKNVFAQQKEFFCTVLYTNTDLIQTYRKSTSICKSFCIRKFPHLDIFGICKNYVCHCFFRYSILVTIWRPSCTSPMSVSNILIQLFGFSLFRTKSTFYSADLVHYLTAYIVWTETEPMGEQHP